MAAVVWCEPRRAWSPKLAAGNVVLERQTKLYLDLSYP